MARVSLGIEGLRDSGWAALAGRSVAALVHAASALPDTLEHTVDTLHAAAPTAGINFSAILAPEHGFRGDRQAEHGDPAPYVDEGTGIWVHSVYRRSEQQLAHLLSDTLKVDFVLVDIQDVGHVRDGAQTVPAVHVSEISLKSC